MLSAMAVKIVRGLLKTEKARPEDITVLAFYTDHLQGTCQCFRTFRFSNAKISTVEEYLNQQKKMTSKQTSSI